MLTFPRLQRSLWSGDQFALLSLGDVLEEFPNSTWEPKLSGLILKEAGT